VIRQDGKRRGREKNSHLSRLRKKKKARPERAERRPEKKKSPANPAGKGREKGKKGGRLFFPLYLGGKNFFCSLANRGDGEGKGFCTYFETREDRIA